VSGLRKCCSATDTAGDDSRRLCVAGGSSFGTHGSFFRNAANGGSRALRAGTLDGVVSVPAVGRQHDHLRQSAAARNGAFSRVLSTSMNRRHILSLFAVTAVPLPARAATARIAILNSDNPEPLGSLLRKSLRGLGYREGETLEIEFRLANGDAAALPGLAAELVRLKVDLIVAYLTPAAGVAKQATRDIPIIMMGAGDPVGSGLVASLARPGGNVTGTSATTSEAGTKILGVLCDIIPSLKRAAVLTNATDPFTPSFLGQAKRAAQLLQLDLRTVALHSGSELDPAFAGLKNDKVQAVLVQPSLPRDKVAELAIRHRLPAIAPTRSFAALGGVAAYSPNLEEIAQRTAVIVDKVLKGARPADIPVEQPTRFELVINLKTARSIGVEVPKSVLGLADEVID